MSEGSYIYFASDFHLGVPAGIPTLERERKIVRWLRSVQPSAKEIYLLGDVFDFWFEYKSVVPKGYVRLLSCLADIVESGVPVTIFTGNHDMWMFDYLEQEVGVTIQREPIVKEWSDKRFYIGHGDGLGPGDYQYKFLKLFFASRFCQWLFARLHPNFSFGIAQFWSKKSRLANLKNDEEFKSKESEWLYQYCQSLLKDEKYDYFVFGHRHLPLELSVEGSNSTYVNLGEWVTGNCHYAIFDGNTLRLEKYEG